MKLNPILFDLYNKTTSTSHRLERIEYNYICDNSLAATGELDNQLGTFMRQQQWHQNYDEYKILLNGISSDTLANILQNRCDLRPVLVSATVEDIYPGNAILYYDNDTQNLRLRIFDGFIDVDGNDIPNYRYHRNNEGYYLYGVLIIPAYTYVEPE